MEIDFRPTIIIIQRPRSTADHILLFDYYRHGIPAAVRLEPRKSPVRP